MAKRFKDVISLLEYEELLRVKSDLNKGGDGIRILLDNKIKEEVKKKNSFCAVCASKIEPESTTKFHLAFGPDELKKEISFCAVDCMEYFLKELKKVKLK
jgi:hypothetical protein